jgi:hypothetical protein
MRAWLANWRSEYFPNDSDKISKRKILGTRQESSRNHERGIFRRMEWLGCFQNKAVGVLWFIEK